VTLRDLADDLGAAALLWSAPELGTLNHTALTLEALGTQGIPCAGLVLGSWPRHPDVVATSNRSALERMAPVRAVLPAGAHRWTRGVRVAERGGVRPGLGNCGGWLTAR